MGKQQQMQQMQAEQAMQQEAQGIAKADAVAKTRKVEADARKAERRPPQPDIEIGHAPCDCFHSGELPTAQLQTSSLSRKFRSASDVLIRSELASRRGCDAE